MSVRGEFLRVLGDLTRFLRASGVAECEALADALDACAAEAKDDLSGAATRARGLCAAAPPESLGPSQRQEHAERCEHLTAICRSLLG